MTSQSYDAGEELLEFSKHLQTQGHPFNNPFTSNQHLDYQRLSNVTSTPTILQETYTDSSHHNMSRQGTPSWNSDPAGSTSFNHSQALDGHEYGLEQLTAYTTHGTIDSMYGRGMAYGGVPRTWESYKSGACDSYAAASFSPLQEKIELDRMDQRFRAVFQSLESPAEYSLPDTPEHPMSGGFYSQKSSTETKFGGHDGLPRNSSMTGGTVSGDEADETDGLTSREMTATELDDPTSDEPYAKLIYRALMSRPSRSMVLQEIYQWFREHTNKGNSDGKGWMNSIRHNLSMNAAFRKSECKHSTDESKKSTEWVLEDFAIKEGVQSTTRYRKGTAKKHPRLDAPAPIRQRSGQKGGTPSRSSGARGRRAPNFRAPTSSHGIPLLDTSPIGLGCDGNMIHQFAGQLDMEVDTPQRSPLTPPLADGPSALYYGFAAKVEAPPAGFPLEYGHGLCGLEHVQGVYLDDDEPVFADMSGGHRLRQHHEASTFTPYAMRSGGDSSY